LTDVVRNVKFAVSQSKFSARFGMRDAGSGLRESASWTIGSESAAAGGQTGMGGIKASGLLIGIIAALAFLLGLIVLLIIGWRRTQSKTDDIEMAYDIETEFREEAIGQSDVTFDDDDMDLDVLNDVMGQPAVNLNSDGVSLGCEESIFQY
jgi:hypothetical protein